MSCPFFKIVWLTINSTKTINITDIYKTVFFKKPSKYIHRVSSEISQTLKPITANKLKVILDLYTFTFTVLWQSSSLILE